MLTLMIVLAIPCCFIEYKLTANRPKVRLFLGEHKIAALVFSTFISLVFGTIFGAEGLIIFGSGMISTMIMVIIYGISPVIEENREGFTMAGHMMGIGFKTVLFVALVPFKAIAFVAGIFSKGDDTAVKA